MCEKSEYILDRTQRDDSDYIATIYCGMFLGDKISFVIFSCI